MKSLHTWNRRDFIVRPVAGLAASQLLGSFRTCSDRRRRLLETRAKNRASAKPICRTLGKTGITLPIVSMGVMNADVPGLVKRAYEVGIKHFDTAAFYQQGRNEQMVGNMIQEMGVRDKVIISTKVLRPGFGFGREQGTQAPARTYTPTEVKAHFLEIFAGSLKRLQMDHVDILYNHAADSEADINSEGAIAALTQLKKEGKTCFIGVSSHQPELALKLAMKSGAYDVVLIAFNYTVANDESLLRTIDEAAKKGIGIVAMKTQAGGLTRPDPRLNKHTNACESDRPAQMGFAARVDNHSYSRLHAVRTDRTKLRGCLKPCLHAQRSASSSPTRRRWRRHSSAVNAVSAAEIVRRVWTSPR